MNTQSTSQLASHRALRHAEIGVLLGVWAHPDDEAYMTTAGLMSMARAAGHRVVVATATKANPAPTIPSPSRLSDLWLSASRRLRPASRWWTSANTWLGHRDGTVGQAPVAQGVHQVAELIEEIRPDTVVTFGPDGLTGHADHKAVSGWVTVSSGMGCGELRGRALDGGSHASI